MRQTKKNSEPHSQEVHEEYLQQLYNESRALNKLIKKLEERENLKSKPDEEQHPKD